MSHQCQHVHSGACHECKNLRPTGLRELQEHRTMLNQETLNVIRDLRRRRSRATRNRSGRWQMVIRFNTLTRA